MRGVRGFLVSALRQPPSLPALSAEDWRLLPEQANDHGLSPRVHALLADTAAPRETRAALRADVRTALAGQLQVDADLRRLVPVLERAGVPWAIVKGPVLADHWYQARGQRGYTDLDLVVQPQGFAEVLSACLEAGAQLVDRNWTLALAQQRAEISLQLWHGTALDLHWHVLNTPALRREIPIDISAILERAQAVTLDGRHRVKTFDPVDTLLHLCLHTILSGGHQLSWYRDLEQVITREPVDWDTLMARTWISGAGLPVQIALRRTRTLTGAAVPQRIVRGAAPRGGGWGAVVAAIDAARPLGHPLHSRLSGRLIVEASRDDTRSSVTALRRSLAADLVAPVLHDPQHPWRRRSPEVLPRENPLSQEPAHSSDEERYFEFVRCQGSA